MNTSMVHASGALILDPSDFARMDSEFNSFPSKPRSLPFRPFGVFLGKGNKNTKFQAKIYQKRTKNIKNNSKQAITSGK